MKRVLAKKCFEFLGNLPVLFLSDKIKIAKRLNVISHVCNAWKCEMHCYSMYNQNTTTNVVERYGFVHGSTPFRGCGFIAHILPQVAPVAIHIQTLRVCRVSVIHN
jgi:hypothetical protein